MFITFEEGRKPSALGLFFVDAVWNRPTRLGPNGLALPRAVCLSLLVLSLVILLRQCSFTLEVAAAAATSPTPKSNEFSC